jgi:hypothetical protein
MAEISEADALAYLMRLADLEEQQPDERATITVGPFTAFTLIGALQLAMRHPGFSPVQTDLVGQVIDQLRPLFAGTPGEQLLRLGDDPAFDIPRDCTHPLGPHSPACPPGGHTGFAGG